VSARRARLYFTCVARSRFNALASDGDEADAEEYSDSEDAPFSLDR
jgi:hypothetical protein